MSEINFHSDGELVSSCELSEGESLLEGLLSQGHRIPNSCRAGLCHACVMQEVSECAIPAQAQVGLSELQCQQRMLLSCQCYPQQNLSVSLPAHDQDWLATVVGHRMLNDQVLELRLKTDGHWEPGQHLLLWRNDEQARPYSIASRCDADKELALHVKHHQNGEVSSWCHQILVVGDTVKLSAPEGHCCYSGGDTSADLLLAATGTGLAPLYGILLEALASGHSGSINLYVSARNENSFYLVDELVALAAIHDNFTVQLVVGEPATDAPADWPLVNGTLESVIAERHPSLRGSKVFLCGNPEMVERLTKRCFFAGARRGDIASDAFISGSHAARCLSYSMSSQSPCSTSSV